MEFPLWTEWRDSLHHITLVIIGLSLAIIGAFTSGFGMVLIKGSGRLEADRPLYRKYRLLIGISLACWINTTLDVIAFALCPLAIIAPIGGITIVAAVLFASSPCTFAGRRELVSATQWMAIFCVVAGVGVVAVFGPHPAPVLDVDQVVKHFYNSSFLVY